MRGVFAALGLIALLTAPAAGQADMGPPEDSAPALPPSLAEAAGRDSRADAVEGRSATNTAMINASAAYMRRDYELALIHAERAAAGGEPRGATMAGHILLHGLTDEVDDAGAVRWLRRAAELGEPDALVILARLAEAGRGGLSSWQAREFLSEAANNGDARAAHEFGLYLMEQGDPGAAETALDWLRLAAESGHEEAYADYAHALGEWTLGPHDLSSARVWYERAGEAGHPLSALMAGTMYLTGEGGPPDPERGARLVRMAAEFGLPAAMGQYALLLFQDPQGLQSGPEDAAGWARRGAEAGDAESQFLYAYALALGDGVPRDPDRAYFWVLRAGFHRDGGLDGDPDRERLRGALEGLLTDAAAERIRAEAAAASARPAYAPPR